RSFIQPNTEVGDVLRVQLPVIGVGVGEPGVEEEIQISLGETLVDETGVELLLLDRVAVVLEDDMPQVREGDVLVPWDPPDGDRSAFAPGGTVVLDGRVRRRGGVGRRGRVSAVIGASRG